MQRIREIFRATDVASQRMVLESATTPWPDTLIDMTTIGECVRQIHHILPIEEFNSFGHIQLPRLIESAEAEVTLVPALNCLSPDLVEPLRDLGALPEGIDHVPWEVALMESHRSDVQAFLTTVREDDVQEDEKKVPSPLSVTLQEQALWAQSQKRVAHKNDRKDSRRDGDIWHPPQYTSHRLAHARRLATCLVPASAKDDGAIDKKIKATGRQGVGIRYYLQWEHTQARLLRCTKTTPTGVIDYWPAEAQREQSMYGGETHSIARIYLGLEYPHAPKLRDLFWIMDTPVNWGRCPIIVGSHFCHLTNPVYPHLPVSLRERAQHGTPPYEPGAHIISVYGSPRQFATPEVKPIYKIVIRLGKNGMPFLEYCAPRNTRDDTALDRIKLLFAKEATGLKPPKRPDVTIESRLQSQVDAEKDKPEPFRLYGNAKNRGYTVAPNPLAPRVKATKQRSSRVLSQPSTFLVPHSSTEPIPSIRKRLSMVRKVREEEQQATPASSSSNKKPKAKRTRKVKPKLKEEKAEGAEGGDGAAPPPTEWSISETQWLSGGTSDTSNVQIRALQQLEGAGLAKDFHLTMSTFIRGTIYFHPSRFLAAMGFTHIQQVMDMIRCHDSPTVFASYQSWLHLECLPFLLHEDKDPDRAQAACFTFMSDALLEIGNRWINVERQKKNKTRLDLIKQGIYFLHQRWLPQLNALSTVTYERMCLMYDRQDVDGLRDAFMPKAQQLSYMINQLLLTTFSQIPAVSKLDYEYRQFDSIRSLFGRNLANAIVAVHNGVKQQVMRHLCGRRKNFISEVEALLKEGKTSWIHNMEQHPLNHLQRGLIDLVDLAGAFREDPLVFEQTILQFVGPKDHMTTPTENCGINQTRVAANLASSTYVPIINVEHRYASDMNRVIGNTHLAHTDLLSSPSGGGAAGYRKILASHAGLSHGARGTDMLAMLQYLRSIRDVGTPRRTSGRCVFQGIDVGFFHAIQSVHDRFLNLKRFAKLRAFREVSVVLKHVWTMDTTHEFHGYHSDLRPELHIAMGPGRIGRYVFMVDLKTQTPAIPEDKESDFSLKEWLWRMHDLQVCATMGKDPQFLDACHRLRYWLQAHGCIVFIDAAEAKANLVAEAITKLRPGRTHYQYCELGPVAMMASITKLLDHVNSCYPFRSIGALLSIKGSFGTPGFMPFMGDKTTTWLLYAQNVLCWSLSSEGIGPFALPPVRIARCASLSLDGGTILDARCLASRMGQFGMSIQVDTRKEIKSNTTRLQALLQMRDNHKRKQHVPFKRACYMSKENAQSMFPGVNLMDQLTSPQTPTSSRTETHRMKEDHDPQRIFVQDRFRRVDTYMKPDAPIDPTGDPMLYLSADASERSRLFIGKAIEFETGTARQGSYLLGRHHVHRSQSLFVKTGEGVVETKEDKELSSLPPSSVDSLSESPPLSASSSSSSSASTQPPPRWVHDALGGTESGEVRRVDQHQGPNVLHTRTIISAIKRVAIADKFAELCNLKGVLSTMVQPRMFPFCSNGMEVDSMESVLGRFGRRAVSRFFMELMSNPILKVPNAILPCTNLSIRTVRHFSDQYLEDQGVDLTKMQIPLEVAQALAVGADPDAGLFAHVTAYQDAAYLVEQLKAEQVRKAGGTLPGEAYVAHPWFRRTKRPGPVNFYEYALACERVREYVDPIGSYPDAWAKELSLSQSRSDFEVSLQEDGETLPWFTARAYEELDKRTEQITSSSSEEKEHKSLGWWVLGTPSHAWTRVHSRLVGTIVQCWRLWSQSEVKLIDWRAWFAVFANDVTLTGVIPGVVTPFLIRVLRQRYETRFHECKGTEILQRFDTSLHYGEGRSPLLKIALPNRSTLEKDLNPLQEVYQAEDWEHETRRLVEFYTSVMYDSVTGRRLENRVHQGYYPCLRSRKLASTQFKTAGRDTTHNKITRQAGRATGSNREKGGSRLDYMALMAILAYGNISLYQEFMTQNSDHLKLFFCATCRIITDRSLDGDNICPSPTCTSQTPLVLIETAYIVATLLRDFNTTGIHFAFVPSKLVKSSYLAKSFEEEKKRPISPEEDSKEERVSPQEETKKLHQPVADPLKLEELEPSPPPSQIPVVVEPSEMRHRERELEQVFTPLSRALRNSSIEVMENVGQENGERAVYRIENMPGHIMAHLAHMIRGLPGLLLAHTWVHKPYSCTAMSQQHLIDHLRQLPIIGVPEWLQSAKGCSNWSQLNATNSLRFRLYVKGAETSVEKLVPLTQIRALEAERMTKQAFGVPSRVVRQRQTTQGLTNWMDDHPPIDEETETHVSIAFEQTPSVLPPSASDAIPVTLRATGLLPPVPESYITGVQPNTRTVYSRELEFVPQGKQVEDMLGSIVPCALVPDAPLTMLLPHEEIHMDVWYVVSDPSSLLPTDTWTGLVQQNNVTIRYAMNPVVGLDTLPSSAADQLWKTCGGRECDENEPNCFDLVQVEDLYRVTMPRPWACTECGNCAPILRQHGLEPPQPQLSGEHPNWIFAGESVSDTNMHEQFRKGVQRTMHVGYTP